MANHPDFSAPGPAWREDPTVTRSRREAAFILGLWACCFVYTVTYCYLFGYQSHEPLPADLSTGPAVGALVGPLPGFDRTADSLTEPFGLGIPDWVFWGVVVPWLACILISLVFCLFFFQEIDLGRDPETAEVGED